MGLDEGWDEGCGVEGLEEESGKEKGRGEEGRREKEETSEKDKERLEDGRREKGEGKGLNIWDLRWRWLKGLFVHQRQTEEEEGGKEVWGVENRREDLWHSPHLRLLLLSESKRPQRNQGDSWRE